ncbi:MAG: ribonuclease H-like domain-containing protein [Blautia sp.]|nr:ribonuclease H-like domain-containing protein [Blautia sp.]
MIVKKIPYLQGFPGFETVKNLSFPRVKSGDFRPVFYDIETTGLSRNSTFLYLIGAIAYIDDSWQLFQWMAETPKEESSVLKAFAEFVKDFTCLISYNGEHFDSPYLETRCSVHKIPFPFEGKTSLDLYLHLKPLKKLLKLPALKQPCLEEFLGIGNRIYCDGKDCIKLYKDFLKKRDSVTADTVIGHNLEDILGLGKIFMMLGYLNLCEGNYEIISAEPDDGHLIFTLALPSVLPAPFSNGNDAFYLTGKDSSVRLIIKAVNGRFRQYYPNYKDYDYLPAEDTAIPKALSSCMDKKLRKSATKNTCYTWFTCTEAFLESPQMQKQYLSHTLTYLLSTLK